VVLGFPVEVESEVNVEATVEAMMVVAEDHVTVVAVAMKLFEATGLLEVMEVAVGAAAAVWAAASDLTLATSRLQW